MMMFKAYKWCFHDALVVHGWWFEDVAITSWRRFEILFSMSCFLPLSSLGSRFLMLDDLLTAVLDPFPGLCSGFMLNVCNSKFQHLKTTYPRFSSSSSWDSTCLPVTAPEGHATLAASNLAIVNKNPHIDLNLHIFNSHLTDYLGFMDLYGLHGLHGMVLNGSTNGVYPPP